MMRKMKTFIGFIKVDLLKIVQSARFWGSIAGITIMLLFISSSDWHAGVSVLYLFETVALSMPFILTLVLSALPYAYSFCEEFENKYMYSKVHHGSISAYSLSKIFVIFVSSLITMLLGIFCFILILRCKFEWVIPEDYTRLFLIEGGGFRYLLNNEFFLSYFFLGSLQYGILAGILSIFASYVSLFVSNKLLVLSCPVLLFYLFEHYSAALFGTNIGTEKYSLLMTFNPVYNAFQDDLRSFLYAVQVGIISFLLILYLANRRIRRLF